MTHEWINAGPNGEDYRKEQLISVPKGVDASRTEGRIAFVVVAAVLAAGIIALHHYQVSAGLMISPVTPLERSLHRYNAVLATSSAVMLRLIGERSAWMRFMSR